MFLKCIKVQARYKEQICQYIQYLGNQLDYPLLYALSRNLCSLLVTSVTMPKH